VKLVPNPLKPWYVYRPSQLIRRLIRCAAIPHRPIQTVWLPWGCPIQIDIQEAIGRCIWEAGVYDLAVVEVSSRLASAGDLALDVGANIGAMTSALAARAERVWAFEPHPEVYLRLRSNVAAFVKMPGFGACETFELALAAENGSAVLECPDGFKQNSGIARLGVGMGVSVRTSRLDAILGEQLVGVMKLDVEGAELNVLKGAEMALRNGQLINIIFEDHKGQDGPVMEYLQQFGYSLFEISWRLRGPTLAILGSHSQKKYEAPSYLATRDPNRALTACRPAGWCCLSTARQRV
jgi:FkbM family methyltransferase